MLVMKFGGTSVATPERLANVARLVTGEPRPAVVVTSALGGVTDALIELGAMARRDDGPALEAGLGGIAERHHAAAAAVAAPGPGRDALDDVLERLMAELRQLLLGVRLLRELSPRSSDLLVSFGERLAAPVLSAAIARTGADAEAVDARTILVTSETTGGGGGAAVDMVESRRRTRAALLPLAERVIPVVTGFIAAGEDGRTATLGRGGSDYTATLVGAFLDANEIWIWTDVDGVMTADPRVVPEARVLEAITYREAAEMAYFGSKVLHPRSMIPAVEARIPVVIRSSLRPDRPGTRITDRPAASALGVKTVTSVPDLALVTVEGSGMQGVPGVARRVFSATAGAGINVYMVSQASSEHNISLVVGRDDGPPLVAALEDEFELEIERQQIDRIDMLAPVGIVAVIGEGMKGAPGISQRMFTALGRGRINVLAIAQGSSELNLSTVVHERDVRRAVGAAHSRFGLTRDTHVLVLGKGLVGQALLRQIVTARPRLAAEHGLGLEVIGVCGRRELLFDHNGIDDDRLRAIADAPAPADLGGEPRPPHEGIFARIADSRWLDVIVVDVTAEEHGAVHAAALTHGFHVVTANKKPMAGPLETYDRIMREASAHGVSYRFETTFGAGLPALSTLQDLIATCDEVRSVTGCFSGTLGFICSALDAGTPLSAAVRRARDLGFTEPDPRDDLSGLDVARKALIIARQLGGRLEMPDVALEPMVPAELMSAQDVDEFLARLTTHDEAMAALAADARATGAVLRYVAEISPERVAVGLRRVPAESPTGQLEGPDNILVFTTDRYRDNPLVIRGPGAGAEVTAAGVLGDILTIARGT